MPHLAIQYPYSSKLIRPDQGDDIIFEFRDIKGNTLSAKLSRRQAETLLMNNPFVQVDPTREAVDLYLADKIDIEELEARLDRLRSDGKVT